jgi:hypothetical protein
VPDAKRSGPPLPDPTPEERARGARRLWWVRLYGPVWARDLWQVLVTGLVLISLSSFQSASDRQREGRKVAIQAICGFQNATIKAGRAQLLSSAAVGSPRFERNLERLGYPPRAVREVAAKKAADAYSQTIIRAVANSTNTTGLVQKDGTLNCRALLGASQAKP